MNNPNLEQFIDSLAGLAEASTATRRLTTDPFKAGEEYEYATPVNGLVLIDGKRDSRTILEHDKTTFYVIVSGSEKIRFGPVLYSCVCVIRKDSKSTVKKLFTYLFDTDTLAIDCDNAAMPLQAVGSNNHFIRDPRKYEHLFPGILNDGKTACMMKQVYDLSSKLDINITNNMLCVTPKNSKAPS